MRYLAPLLLLFGTACHPRADHAQAVAAKALPRYVEGLRPASLHAYPVSAAELSFFIRDSIPTRGGHLVTYTCEVALPEPHQATRAAFVDAADSVREFVPDKNLGLFAADYGVDYRMQ
jgi:hypothetical protein